MSGEVGLSLSLFSSISLIVNYFTTPPPLALSLSSSSLHLALFLSLSLPLASGYQTCHLLITSLQA